MTATGAGTRGLLRPCVCHWCWSSHRRRPNHEAGIKPRRRLGLRLDRSLRDRSSLVCPLPAHVRIAGNVIVLRDEIRAIQAETLPEQLVPLLCCRHCCWATLRGGD